MVYELKRVLRVSDGFLCSMSAKNDGAVLLWQWKHKQAICMCFLRRQDANEVTLNVWLY